MKHNDYLDKKDYITKVVVPALKVNGFSKKADCISNCGEFKRLAMCNDCGTLYFNGFASCKDRFCPLCQKKKSLLWQVKVTPIFMDYVNKGHYLCMVTFTIKNTKTLKDGIKIMREAWRYMTHENKIYRAFWDEAFIGGVRTLEVKLSNKKEWHPHFHMLAIKDKYRYDYLDIMRMWDDSVRYVATKYGIYDIETDFDDNLDYKYGSVEMHTIGKNRKYKVQESVRETFKYITKFDWWAVDKVKELIEGLYRVVSISAWGCLYDIKKKVEAEEDMDLTEVEQRYCTMCGSQSFDTNTFKYVHHSDLNDSIHDFKRLIKKPYMDLVAKSYLQLVQGMPVEILGLRLTYNDLVKYNITSMQDFRLRLDFYKKTGKLENYQLSID